MRLAVFVRALVVCVPAAAAQRCELAESAQHKGHVHSATSWEARHAPAHASPSAPCVDAEGAACSAPSFVDLAQNRHPG